MKKISLNYIYYKVYWFWMRNQLYSLFIIIKETLFMIGILLYAFYIFYIFIPLYFYTFTPLYLYIFIFYTYKILIFYILLQFQKCKFKCRCMLEHSVFIKESYEFVNISHDQLMEWISKIPIMQKYYFEFHILKSLKNS